MFWQTENSYGENKDYLCTFPVHSLKLLVLLQLRSDKILLIESQLSHMGDMGVLLVLNGLVKGLGKTSFLICYHSYMQ